MIELDERKVSHFFDDPDNRSRLEALLKEGGCYPTNVVIHPTMLCNHRCDFCNYFHNLDERDKIEGGKIKINGSIETYHMVKFFEEFDKCGVKALVISGGGDPLLHKDIEVILENALRFKFRKHFYTNLDFDLSDHVIELLSKFDSVNLNINTTDDGLYKLTRGKNSNISRVVDNVSKLKEKSALINAVIVVRDNTLQTLDATIDRMRDCGFSSLTISPAFDLGYRDGGSASEKTMGNLVRIKKKSKSKADIRVLRNVEDAVLKDDKIYCRTHLFDITIGADYNVYPCCMTSYTSGYSVINLRKFGSFTEAWESDERKERITQLNFGCNRCWFGAANDYLKTLGVS